MTRKLAWAAAGLLATLALGTPAPAQAQTGQAQTGQAQTWPSRTVSEPVPIRTLRRST